jgi:hypothetical protein
MSAMPHCTWEKCEVGVQGSSRDFIGSPHPFSALIYILSS